MSFGVSRKRLHFASTAWFVLCVGYVLTFSLLDAGVHWWILFSLSGYGLLILLLLISLYLFAIFRGISSSQTVKIEHPLTSTGYYMYFYNLSPFLGGVAGLLGMVGLAETGGQYVVGVALGTLAMTFMIWVVVDPAIGVLETALSSAGRRHRSERLIEAAAEARRREEHRERLLGEVLQREQQDIQEWKRQLGPRAERLAELITMEDVDAEEVEREAVGIGVTAWQMGGLACMGVLRSMAVESGKRVESGGVRASDYISFWWDGIGTWQMPLIQDLRDL